MKDRRQKSRDLLAIDRAWDLAATELRDPRAAEVGQDQVVVVPVPGETGASILARVRALGEGRPAPLPVTYATSPDEGPLTCPKCGRRGRRGQPGWAACPHPIHVP